MTTLTSTSGVKTQENARNVRMQIVQELLSSGKYETYETEYLINHAHEIAKFVLNGELYQCDSCDITPNAKPRGNAVIPKGTCIKLAGVEYYPVEDVQLGEIDGRDRERLAMAIFSVKEGSKDEILRVGRDVEYGV